jgi:hypothetical protein
LEAATGSSCCRLFNNEAEAMKKFSTWVNTILTVVASPAGTEKVAVVSAAGTPGYVTLNEIGQRTFNGSGNPNGVVTAPAGAATYIQAKLTPSGNKGLWLRDEATAGDTGWEESIVAQ